MFRPVLRSQVVEALRFFRKWELVSLFIMGLGQDRKKKSIGAGGSGSHNNNMSYIKMWIDGNGMGLDSFFQDWAGPEFFLISVLGYGMDSNENPLLYDPLLKTHKVPCIRCTSLTSSFDVNPPASGDVA